MRGGGEGVRHVAVGHLELRQHIGLRFAPHFRRARCERGFQVGDERQRIVVDLDRSHRVLGEVARFGDHHRHRLADEAHLARREHEGRDVLRQRRRRKTQRHAQPHAGLLQVRGCEDRCHLARGAGIDIADQRMCMRAAHERRMQHAGQLDVGGVAPGAAQQARILDATRARADDHL